MSRQKRVSPSLLAHLVEAKDALVHGLTDLLALHKRHSLVIVSILLVAVVGALINSISEVRRDLLLSFELNEEILLLRWLK